MNWAILSKQVFAFQNLIFLHLQQRTQDSDFQNVEIALKN